MLNHTICKYKMFNMKFLLNYQNRNICLSATTCQPLSAGRGDIVVKTVKTLNRENPSSNPYDAVSNFEQFHSCDIASAV